MLSTLIKKQLSESFSFFYFNSKKGELRTGKNKIFYILLMVLIFGGLAASFFAMCMSIAGPLFGADAGYVYWALEAILSIAFGVFGSVFNTYSTVYLAKDNELLLSMPIKISDILIARLFSVYSLGVFYSILIFLPAMIASWIAGGFSFGLLIAQLLLFVSVSLIVLALSAILGWGVAIASVHLKNRSFTVVFLSLLFMAAYYYCYSRASIAIGAMVNNAGVLAQTIKNDFGLIYELGMAGMGQISSVCIQLGLTIIITVLVYYLIKRNYVAILTVNRGEKKVAYKEASVTQTSVRQALLRREISRFTKSSVYMLNCGLGSVLILVAAVALLFNQTDIHELLLEVNAPADVLLAVCVAILAFISTMNDITAPSISLEGQSIWIAQTLPVSGWQILQAKIHLHLLITLPPVWIFCGVVCYIMGFDAESVMVLFILASEFVAMCAMDGLMVGLKFPVLTWTNETVAVKQGASVAVAIFGNWLLIGLLTLLVFLAHYIFTIGQILVVLIVVFAVVCRLMRSWIATAGANIFYNL